MPEPPDIAALQRRQARIEAMREAQQVERWVRSFCATERERVMRALETMETPADPARLADCHKDLRWLKRLERSVDEAIRSGKRAMEEKS